MEASRRLGGKESQDAISWWSRYRRLQTPERLSLFGATLTGNELRDYQSYTAKPSDSADTIKTFLRDQINYLKDNSEKQKIFYQAAGYKIPSDMKKINYEETYEGSDKSTSGDINAKPRYSQEDLEFTARDKGMTVDQVKKALGIE